MASALVLAVAFDTGDLPADQAPPVTEQIVVLVRDRQSGAPLASKVFLLNAEQKKIPVGETSPGSPASPRPQDGQLTIHHGCALGDRFKAEPADLSYYSSGESQCGSRIVLTLRKRETPLGFIARHAERTLTIRSRSGKTSFLTLEWNTAISPIRSTAIAGQLTCTYEAEASLLRVIGEPTAEGWREQTPGSSRFKTLSQLTQSRRQVQEAICRLRSEQLRLVEKDLRDELARQLDEQLQDVMVEDLRRIELELKTSSDVESYSLGGNEPPAGDGGHPPSAPPGLVVEEVGVGSALEKAGILAGDRLLSWTRSASAPASQVVASGAFDSVFDWDWLTAEESPRGAVRLAGERDGVAFARAVQPGSWKAKVRPAMPAAVFAEYALGEKELSSHQAPKGLARWTRLLDHLPQASALRCWLALRTAEGYDQNHEPDHADEMFKAALQDAAAPIARVTVLTAVADSLAARDRFAEAVKTLRTVLDLWESVAGKQLAYAKTLRAIARGEYSKGDLDLAEKDSLAALDIEVRRAPESLGLADSCTTLGLIAQTRGRLEEAMMYLICAADLDARLVPDGLEIAADFHNFGVLAYERSNFDEAEIYDHTGLEVTLRLAPDSMSTAESYNNLGVLSERASRFDQAETYYACALELEQRLEPEGTESALSLNNLGVLSFVRGDLTVAETYFSHARTIQERLVSGSLDLAKTLSNLGAVASERGDLEAASEFFNQTLAIEQTVIPESPEYATSLGNRGALAFVRGNFELAEFYLKAARKLQEKVSAGGPDLAITLNNLGNVALQLGCLDAATKAHLDALKLRPPESLDRAVTLENLGIIAYRRHDLASAEAYLQEALAIQKRLAPESLAVAETLNNLADVSLGLGRREIALEQLNLALKVLDKIAPRMLEEAVTLHSIADIVRSDNPRLAVSYLRRALEALDGQEGKLGGSNEIKATFRAQYISYYKELIDMLVEQGENEAAFDVLERSRARSFLAMLAEREVVFARDIPDELERKRRRLDVQYNRLLQELISVGQGVREDELRGRLHELREQHDELEAQIRKSSPRLASLKYPRLLTLEAVRKTLDPGTVMLAYSVSERVTQLFVIAKDKPLLVKTVAIGEPGLAEQVKDLGTQIQAYAKAPGEGRQQLERIRIASQHLYERLLAPAQHLIEASRRLLVVPDGPLHRLPWSALGQGSGRGVEGWRYLVEWKPVHVALSATVYGELKATRRTGRGASGTPVFVGFADPACPKTQMNGELERCRPLPGSRTEVNHIAEMFGANARTFLAADATGEGVRALSRSTRYVHFAVDGILNEGFPLDSGLQLAPRGAGAERGDDGILRAWEVFESVRVDADLVVLSACQSGVGKEVSGEGLIGLTRAFHYAGARSVLASLWQVEDVSTGEFMVRFYRYLAKGKAKDEALRLTQIDFIRNRVSLSADGRPIRQDVSFPFFWAAFQVFGDWR